MFIFDRTSSRSTCLLSEKGKLTSRFWSTFLLTNMPKGYLRLSFPRRLSNTLSLTIGRGTFENSRTPYDVDSP